VPENKAKTQASHVRDGWRSPLWGYYHDSSVVCSHFRMSIEMLGNLYMHMQFPIFHRNDIDHHLGRIKYRSKYATKKTMHSTHVWLEVIPSQFTILPKSRWNCRKIHYRVITQIYQKNYHEKYTGSITTAPRDSFFFFLVWSPKSLPKLVYFRAFEISARPERSKPTFRESV
jgi:hypothetical protein